MDWPSDAIVPLSAALVEMAETEVECELALNKVRLRGVLFGLACGVWCLVYSV
jgi:hypothetical protein